jgi:hypothetical protein
MLKSWIRARDGRWIGIVDFSISDSNGAHVIRATDVPIAAEVLTELKEGCPVPLTTADPAASADRLASPGNRHHVPHVVCHVV